MTLAEAIYQRSMLLPEPAAREALDFIEFLAQRYGVAMEEGEAALTPAQREALARLTQVRLHFEGKPIVSRDELYDEARG
jgi:hypothetical protein